MRGHARPINTLLDAPEHLLEMHDRLRTSGFSVVSVINAQLSLDARVWLCRWASEQGRLVIVAPETTTEVALAAYRARMPRGALELARPAGLPLLLIIGEFRQALGLSVSLTATHPQLPVAIACSIANVVESLLAPEMPRELVIAALQGLVPVEDTSRKIVKTVAEARQLEPFVRGPCEGLLYYMLEARQETRARFTTNGRLTNTAGQRSHEVDLVCVKARLVIEIDGPEHNNQQRKAMDAKKQKDLESQGYRILRFSNQEVMENPVGVWRLIAGDLDMHAAR